MDEKEGRGTASFTERRLRESRLAIPRDFSSKGLHFPVLSFPRAEAIEAEGGNGWKELLLIRNSPLVPAAAAAAAAVCHFE